LLGKYGVELATILVLVVITCGNHMVSVSIKVVSAARASFHGFSAAGRKSLICYLILTALLPKMDSAGSSDCSRHRS